MTAPLPADGDGRIALAAWDRIVELAGPATAVACGPGLSRSADLDRLVVRLYQEIAKPMVFDADALNALAAAAEVLAQPGGPRIFTPHPGELRGWSDKNSTATPATRRPSRWPFAAVPLSCSKATAR